MVLSVNKIELFLELAVPKKQANSLKTYCEGLRFCCICLKSNSFSIISQGFSKTYISAPWNIKKPNNKSLDIFIIIYILLISLYAFKFQEHLFSRNNFQ